MNGLIVHGHFYQPPRESPWTGIVPRELGAAPYHDWNERIYHECYRPNAIARIGGDVPDRLVNNYSNISFNFGPTLLSWLQSHHPQTYNQILLADRGSVARHSGHGNAIAQAYGHAILPLCNQRDRLTQIVWGLEDFRYRFGREPESLWLPETACNDETLSLLIDQGLRFVILAPEQAERLRMKKDEPWREVGGNVATTQPYIYRHSDGSGRSLAVFFYHGPLARAIAFEGALSSSRLLVDRFLQVAQTGALVNVATDGETYGHHFKFGDLCLAHALEVEARGAGLWITNYGEYLERYPPEMEVRISNGPAGEGTSWSCAHGVGRWIRDCGCHTGGEAGWTQSWRGPLRAALTFLRDAAAVHFENDGGELLWDPWRARNGYIRLILDPSKRDQFLIEQARRPLSNLEEARALALLEIQRNSLLMFTSCGWFFSDLAGLETVQVMRYAARLIQLQNELGLPLPQREFLEILAEARSNVVELGNGADIFFRSAQPDVEQLVPEATVTT
jgi:alpha-amylase/alpha-mannosidase (GH57 family)